MFFFLPGYRFLAGALGLFLLATGSLPIGRSPFFFSSAVNVPSVLIRIAGAMILAGLFLPSALLNTWYGRVILLAGALVVLAAGLIASLSGRAR